MDFKNDFWPYFNERIKFFFDSLRNLLLSITVVLAAQYSEKDANFSDHSLILNYIGYGLVILTSIHFFAGTFIYFKKPSDLGIKRRAFPIQFVLLIFYITILQILFIYERH